MLPNLALALQLARACQLSYPDAPHSGARPIHQIATALAPVPVMGFEVGHNFAYAAEYPFHVVVAFQGSNDLGDWISNLDTVRVDHGRGKVHNGFHRCMRSLLAPVAAYCAATHKPIYFTGHSLGAAIATLLAVELERPPTAVYLFGSPRVGNAEFAKHYAARIPATFRFENVRDPVPRLPRSWWGFAEVGDRVWFDRDGRLTLNPSFASTLWHQLLLGNRVGSHRMQAYIDNLVFNEALALVAATPYQEAA